MTNNKKESGFTAVDNEILEKLISSGLNGTEFAVALHVIRKTHGFNKKEDEISISQFEDVIPCTRRSIFKAISNLKLVKIITLVKKGSSLKSSNRYAFNKDFEKWQLVKKSKLVKKNTQTSEKKCIKLVKKSIHTKDNIQKTIYKRNTPLPPKGERTQKMNQDQFDIFWNTYPNKKSKKTAQTKFLKLPSSIFEKIMKSLAIQKGSDQWIKDGGKYIPHPSTWINQERWDDEIDEPEKEWQPTLI